MATVGCTGESRPRGIRIETCTHCNTGGRDARLFSLNGAYTTPFIDDDAPRWPPIAQVYTQRRRAGERRRGGACGPCDASAPSDRRRLAPSGPQPRRACSVRVSRWHREAAHWRRPVRSFSDCTQRAPLRPRCSINHKCDYTLAALFESRPNGDFTLHPPSRILFSSALVAYIVFETWREKFKKHRQTWITHLSVFRTCFQLCENRVECRGDTVLRIAAPRGSVVPL